MQLRNAFGLVLAALLLTGCNLPSAAVPTALSNDQAIATVVAETMQAAQTPPSGTAPTEAGSPVAATSASAVASPGTVTPTATTTLTPTATSPGDKPVLTITANSNCRSGPGGSYKNITSYTTGTKLDIVAHDTENDYWQVKIPNSQETCWVWGQYTTTSGNVANVPTAAPATAVPVSVPGRPGNLHYTYECSGGSVSVVLSWNDSSDNEKGFHVYRFDQLIADLPPNSTTYTDSTPVLSGSTLQYNVTAYNDAGESAKRTVQFPVC